MLDLHVYNYKQVCVCGGGGGGGWGWVGRGGYWYGQNLQVEIVEKPISKQTSFYRYNSHDVTILP